MLTWEEVQAIAERNALFLDKQPDDFLNEDVKLSEDELVTLLWLLIDEFDVEDGNIKKTRKNLLIIGRLDSTFQMFASAGGAVLLGKLLKRFSSVIENNVSYFREILGTSAKFNTTRSKIIDLINRRLGIKTDGGVVKDSYVSSLLANTLIKNEAREILYKGVLSGSKVSNLRLSMQNFIFGVDKPGAIYKFYSKFAYDTFGQIDRMASVEFAEEYKLRWFIYAGTIITTSREFCRKHINGIYNVTEAKDWIYQRPAPIGVSELTYDPVLDMGGVNCRHSPIFLTDGMAEELFRRGLSIVPSNI